MNKESGTRQETHEYGNGSELFTVDLEHDGSPNLSHELTVLADAFAEYLSVNSFFCNASVSLLSNPERVDSEIARGAQQTVGSLLARGSEIKAKIELLRAQSRE